MPEHESPGAIVVGVDGSEYSLEALRHALHEASCRGADLHLLHAAEISPAILLLPGDATINTRDLIAAQRAEIWETARSLTEGTDVKVTEIEREGHAGDALVTYGEEIGADLLVIGSRGHGRIANLLLGSTAHNVVTQAHCDVLVVKPTA